MEVLVLRPGCFHCHYQHNAHYGSAIKPNRLMLFRETVVIYCENHMKYILNGQNVEFFVLKLVVHIVTTMI
jgi:hypothetical protein